jgi:UDP:flavonoid glycosyltransferase YjiC (YdhE family)
MHGHLFPAMAILEELRRRGHEISIRALASEVEMLRSLGFEAKPLASEVEALAADDWRARSPVGAATRSTRTFLARAERDAPDLREAIAAERPEALLIDVATWGALGAAEAWGGPWASFCPLPLPLPSRDVPPFGPGLPPGRGAPGRLRNRIGWGIVGRAFDRLALADLNTTRGSVGAPPLPRAHDVFGRAPLLLYMSAEGLDYPRSDWPASVVMIGPCAWDPPAQLPVELAAVEAPFVLVTTSTDFQNDGRLVRTALAALADKHCHVVATLPAANMDGLRVPDNASVLSFVPHSAVLERASCAITHGGMGVTQKALALGVPVCAVPFGRDQFEVARRVEVAGAGTQLYSWRLTPKRLRKKVREATERRPGAERIAEAYDATGGPRAAADAFEERLL